jgi:hypothetical protein
MKNAWIKSIVSFLLVALVIYFTLVFQCEYLASDIHGRHVYISMGLTVFSFTVSQLEIAYYTYRWTH